MISVLALLCSLTGPCDRATAISVIPLGSTSNVNDCGLAAQMTLAQLALRADQGTAWVIRCEPETSIGKEHTA
jgi:hypothetical protein